MNEKKHRSEVNHFGFGYSVTENDNTSKNKKHYQLHRNHCGMEHVSWSDVKMVVGFFFVFFFLFIANGICMQFGSSILHCHEVDGFIFHSKCGRQQKMHTRVVCITAGGCALCILGCSWCCWVENSRRIYGNNKRPKQIYISDWFRFFSSFLFSTLCNSFFFFSTRWFNRKGKRKISDFSVSFVHTYCLLDRCIR